METSKLVSFLDNIDQAAPWLRSLGVEDVQRAHSNLVAMTRAGLTLDLLGVIVGQLEMHLGSISDPDRALNNLERFILASRSPLSLGSLMERDADAMPTLLEIMSTSQHFSDLMIRDPESFDLLRITDGRPVPRDVLVDELSAATLAHRSEHDAVRVLRRYKQRETMRIAYGDIIRGQRIETVTEQISFLADAIVEAAVQFARRQLEEQRGVPLDANGKPARFVVLALGKLGGVELNYSSDIDLIFLRDGEGKTNADRPITNQEFFDRMARLVVKLLTENTDLGIAYRVDLRLRPNGNQGPAVVTLESALRYYEFSGRTWERQAFVKARAMAGDQDLGEQFLAKLEPWIYRRYLSRADISGIKALKRRIEKRATREGGDESNVKTGHGGIRDIEFVIQFLQLLNGGDLPEIRTGNTLQAIARLEPAGCLTHQERTILEETYEFLRKIEHRLQIMFDLQTHTMPQDIHELRGLALRMGCQDDDQRSALENFRDEYASKTELNRKILNHLLHEAFPGDPEADPEVDLVLDPNPSPATIERVLSRHKFRDVPAAYRHLMELAREPISFLSTRRCRHFLAAIAPRLLASIASTPDPDATLVDLSRISDSLGGKGVLWELFSYNEATLNLYVRLCASSPYLSGILTSSPGMIDELMDSLVLDRLPTRQLLRSMLDDLCRGAEDTELILHSFKNSMHLRVGVRDILDKEDLRDTHRALADIAEACLDQITRTEYQRLVERHGEPMTSSGEPCSLIILAMGKLGGSEPNYHSDLDVVFLYEEEGNTQLKGRKRGDATSNQHFFGQLGQRIIKVITQLGPYGRLYELDPRLRPTGKSGSLAVSIPEFIRYFSSRQGQLWERQALCKARPVYGSAKGRSACEEAVRTSLVDSPWQRENAVEIRQMRRRLEETASPRNLKRGPGGTVDIEFAVQMLQLQHGASCPEILQPGTLDAIAALTSQGYLTGEDGEYLARSYRFLRSVESGLRLMNTAARHDLPDERQELKKLAFLLGYEGPAVIQQRCKEYTEQNRSWFDGLFDSTIAVASS